MYSVSAKAKLEAVATVAASLLLVAVPPAALKAIQRQPARPPRRAAAPDSQHQGAAFGTSQEAADTR
jgi:monoamine oxidase